MHRLVRDLYRRVLVVGRDFPHPEGMAYVRRRAKQMFRENEGLTSEEDIKRAVARGRWYLDNEVVGVIKLKKYRTMRERYSKNE